MATSVIPAPPGYAVRQAPAIARRFAPPSPANLFAIGFADRGSVGQAVGVADLIAKFGPRPNYSPMHDSVLTALGEGGATATISRILGPAAAKAKITLSNTTPAAVVEFEADSEGAWAHAITFTTTTTTGSFRRVVVKSGTSTVLDITTDNAAALIAALDTLGLGKATLKAGAWPIANQAETALAGGTDDRANATTATIRAALAKLDKRYGPGILIAPGIDDPAVHAAILEHCAETGRVPFLDLDKDDDEAASTGHAGTVRASSADLVKDGGLFASWAYTRPIVGEPDRLVPWSAVQAGIASRVRTAGGVGVSPFGPESGAARTVVRLYREWTDAERNRLYVAGVNVATDDGASIACWGGTTLDVTKLYQELHHALVRMSLRFDSERILARYLAKPLDADTFATVHGDLDGLCKLYEQARAIYTRPGDPGYAIDLASVNTPDTIAARQLHASLLVRHTNTVDWASLLISAVPTTQSLS